MKTFDGIITIEVAVNDIANHLLSVINPDFPHREMLVETIISTGIKSQNLSFIYNNLHGFTNKINFKVGDNVWHMSVGNCRIIDIDIYATKKVKVAPYPNQITSKDVWVDHTSLLNQEPDNISGDAVEANDDLPT